MIAGYIGTRNVLGMLLMTFGLRQAVRLLPAERWVKALVSCGDVETDRQKKAEATELAQKAAEVLRHRYGVRRVALTADLVSEKPWNALSQIELVVWDEVSRNQDFWEEMSAVFGDALWHVHEPRATSLSQYQDFEANVREL